MSCDATSLRVQWWLVQDICQPEWVLENSHPAHPASPKSKCRFTILRILIMARMTSNVQVALFIMSDFDPNEKAALLSRTKELLKICLFRTSHAGQRSHDSQPASRTASRTILRYRRPPFSLVDSILCRPVSTAFSTLPFYLTTHFFFMLLVFF